MSHLGRIAKLRFLKSGVGLNIPFTNNPIREAQIQLVKDCKKANKFKRDHPSFFGRNPHSVELELIVETKDIQLSWKTLDIKTLESEATLSIPLIQKDFHGPYCDFKGWLRDFYPGSHFTFHVTGTINGSDKLVGIEVYSNTIVIRRDSFPQELWALYD